MKKAKENWINQKCIDIGDCLTRNNTKRAYQIIKDLTKPKDNAAVNIQDKHGKCITDKDGQNTVQNCIHIKLKEMMQCSP